MADFQSTCHVGNQRRVNMTPIRNDGSPGEIEPGSLRVVAMAGGDGIVAAFDDGGFTYRPGTPSLTSYHVTADADLGEGVRTIEAVIDGLGLISETTAFGGFSEGEETPVPPA